MEFMSMVMNAIQSQLFQTVGLAVIVVGIAHLEKRCQQIEERIESLCGGISGAPHEELGDERVVAPEYPDHRWQ